MATQKQACIEALSSAMVDAYEDRERGRAAWIKVATMWLDECDQVEARRVFNALLSKRPSLAREAPICSAALMYESSPSTFTQTTWLLLTDVGLHRIYRGHARRRDSVVQLTDKAIPVRHLRSARIETGVFTALAATRIVFPHASEGQLFPNAELRFNEIRTHRPATETERERVAERYPEWVETDRNPSLLIIYAGIQALEKLQGATAAGNPGTGESAPQYQIIDPMDAEVAACEFLSWLGYGNVRRTQEGSDGGVDLRGDLVVAGVRYRQSLQGRPEVQRIKGIACVEGHVQAVYISSSGFSQPARQWADLPEADIALFNIDGGGHFLPESRRARELVLNRQTQGNPVPTGARLF